MNGSDLSETEPGETGSESESVSRGDRLKRARPWLILPFAILLLVLLVRFGPALWQMIQDPVALEIFVARLGVLGPIALILINALQIIVAPIPGYVVQIAAGFLYGPFWGGVYGSIGLYLGASGAFWLARIYGRPLVERLVGTGRLARWENVTHSTSTVVWFIMLLGPTGDIPYYLAGLSHVSFVKILLITTLIRIPTVFVATAAGSGVMLLSWWQIGVGIGILAAIVLLFFRYQEEVLAWIDRQTQRRMMGKLNQDTIKTDSH